MLNIFLEVVAVMLCFPCLCFMYQVLAALLGERKADNARWDTHLETEQSSGKEVRI